MKKDKKLGLMRILYIFYILLGIYLVSTFAGVGYAKMSGFLYLGFFVSSVVGGLLTFMMLVLHYLLQKQKEAISK